MDPLFCHNASQPFLTLPPELLIQIIMHLRIIDPFLPTRRSASMVSGIMRPAPPTLGWIHITHVCSLIRKVAVTFGKIWSDIYCCSGCLRWLPSFVGRLRGAPISLVFENFGDQEDTAGVLDLFAKPQQHLLRPRHIQASISSSTSELHALVFMRPAPTLEEFVVHWNDTDGYYRLLPSSLRWFASEGAPRLRHLALSGLYFSWSALHFPHLTHLEITRSRDFLTQETTDIMQKTKLLWEVPGDEKVTLIQAAFGPSARVKDDLQDCLTRLPLLESLTLEHVLPALTSEIFTPAVTHLQVTMPRLRRLSLSEDDSGRCDAFLTMIQAPLLELLDVTVRDPDDDFSAMQLDALSHTIANYVQQIALPIHALRVSLKSWSYEWEVSASTQGSPRARQDGDSADLREILHLTLRLGILSGMDEDPSQWHVLKGLLDALPLKEVDSLDVSGPTNCDPPTPTLISQGATTLWLRVFQLCSAARTVRAASSALIPLVPLLASDNVPGIPLAAIHGPQKPAFPRLTSLCLAFSSSNDFNAEIASPWLIHDILLVLTHGLRGNGDTDTDAMDSQPSICQYVEVLRRCFESRVGHASVPYFLTLEVPEEYQPGEVDDLKIRVRSSGVTAVKVTKLTKAELLWKVRRVFIFSSQS